MLFTLSGQKRQPEEKSAKIRRAGYVPAVIYGHGINQESCKIQSNAFAALYQKAGKSSIVDLRLDSESEPRRVLIQDVQYDPLKGAIIHADFHQIREDEEITAEVKVHFEGESPAVKNLGGILVRAVTSLEIKCLPKDLISEAVVSLASLVAIGNVIRLSDLHLPAGIKTVLSPETVVAAVAEQRKEEEAAPVSEQEAIAAQEVAGKKEKKEGEEAESAEAKKEEKKPEAKQKEK